jgi:UDP-N-acetylmuramoyl-L-alanyl-D-glutamate--2,6-diaminopimelate ligase
VLAALAAGIVRRYPLEEMLESAATFLPVQGRLEPVENAKGLSIFVDYAHTDNALSNAIATLREIGKKRIITVFGCGGNRDPAKRPKMGFVAESLSDVAIITSDNPRSEDPLEIIAEILTGLRHPQSARVIPDREEAIRTAIDLCTKDDILLIAGKGHETYQIFSHGTISFDDRAIAQKACR